MVKIYRQVSSIYTQSKNGADGERIANPQRYRQWIEDEELLVYADLEQLPEWEKKNIRFSQYIKNSPSDFSRVQFPRRGRTRTNIYIIKTEKDLVNARMRHNNELYQTHRGSITFPVAEKQPIHISLGENANKSTFVHELGHFYLWNLKRLVAMDITANRPMSYSIPLVKDVDGKPVEVGENTLTHVARWNEDLQAIAGWWSDNAAELARQSARYGENLKLSEGGFRD